MIPKLAKKYLRGLSLVELMVALVISSILMGGVIYVFNLSKRTYTLQTALAELHDNARFVMDEFTREVRMAGYFGCSGNPPVGVGAPFKSAVGDNDVSVGAGFPPTDTLIMTSFTEQLNVKIDGQFDLTETKIPLLPGSIFPTIDEKIIVSNCRHSHYYKVTGLPTVANPEITITPGFLYNYFPPVEVFRKATSTTYKVLHQGKDFDLFKCENDVCDPNEPFVEGVQSMQIRYGIDTDDDFIPNRYVTVPTGGNVASIRITLLMRTVSKKGIVCSVNKSFKLDSDLTSYAPKETGYCYRLFVSTINVRNRKDTRNN